MSPTIRKAKSSLEDVEQKIEIKDREANWLKVLALVLFSAWIGCSMLSFQGTKKPGAVTPGFGYINK